MDNTKLKNYLEVTTNVAVVLVALVVLSAFARGLFNQGQKPQLESGLQKGQKLERLPAGIEGNKNETLVVALSTTCKLCTESVPFYNRLAETQKNRNNPISIVAVFSNPENEVSEYAQRERLTISTMGGIDLKSLNLPGTPMLILIDSGGKVRDFWIGKLSNEEEEQVIKVVRMNT